MIPRQLFYSPPPLFLSDPNPCRCLAIPDLDYSNRLLVVIPETEYGFLNDIMRRLVLVRFRDGCPRQSNGRIGVTQEPIRIRFRRCDRETRAM